MSTRRQFLKNASMGAAALAIAPTAMAAEEKGRASLNPPAGGKPRRVIFMISDGMSIGVPSMAEEFSKIARNKPTKFAELLQDHKVAHGFCETHSLSSLVTDSAAAASALGSGTRVFNGSINVLPDGRELRPIHHLLKEQGVGTGLVTTARVTHATPAGFGAVQSSRDDEDLIAPQYIDKVDVILGGGARHFFPEMRRMNKDDVAGAYEAAGYAVVREKKAMLGAPKDKPLLGVFDKSHVPYTIDQNHSKELQETVPTLAEMTQEALDRLAKNPKGFLLQVEGARVDHAAHGNDIAATLWDQLAFDDAIEIALEFQKNYPDTLIIVTSDHGNSNPGLNGMGSYYGDSTEFFERIAKAKRSFDGLEWGLKKSNDATAESVKGMIQDGWGIELPLDECQLILDRAKGKDVGEVNELERGFSGIFAQVLGNHNGVGFTGCNHTQDMVVLAAVGPGQDGFNGLIKNTDAFENVAKIFGLKYRNPAMTPQEAKSMAYVVPERRMADWA
ncbi:alkaline phosphatase [bacterium]|nr:alkaline phosphatase [bacterium]